MKLVLMSILIVGCFATYAQNPIDGTWKGTRDTPNGSFEITYTYKVEGKVLTGTWKSDFGETKLENGKVDGKKISYSFSINEMTINYTGELVGEDEILLKNERGDMKLARVK